MTLALRLSSFVVLVASVAVLNACKEGSETSRDTVPNAGKQVASTNSDVAQPRNTAPAPTTRLPTNQDAKPSGSCGRSAPLAHLPKLEQTELNRLRALAPDRGVEAAAALAKRVGLPSGLKLIVNRTMVGRWGSTVVRLGLASSGVPVRTGGWVVELCPDGSLQETSGGRLVDLALLAKLSTTPSQTRQNAVLAAQKDNQDQSASSPEVELAIRTEVSRHRTEAARNKSTKELNAADFFRRVDGYTLVYVVEVGQWLVEVDAHSGAVLSKTSTIVH